jgi:hypothetical protein
VTCTFSFTGKADKLIVPAGVTLVTIDAKGAQGGTGDVAGGNGASVNADFPVTPNETLNVVVGGMGGGPINQAGGGGGGSFVYRSATATGLLIAAAGGGGSRVNGAGTAGSPTTKASDGQTGTEGYGQKGGAAGTGGNGGAGGTAGNGFPSTGAGGGGLLTDGGDGSGPRQHPAIGGNALVNGAAGGNGQNSGLGAGSGGFGGGGGASLGGGGGGGYNGGGGGAGGLVGGGGGGSFIASSATRTGASGTNTGNGLVTITYLTLTCPAGQTLYRLRANTNVGIIRGVFCVDPGTGIGTYGQFPVGTQGFVSGTGEVNSLFGVTDIAASGNNLKLSGEMVVAFNFFKESSPVNATGTFTLR